MLMHRACKLARRGEGFVEPNPMVGAVVANSDGTVLGEGWHKRFGSAHAEVHALAMAGEAARDATLFVTLLNMSLDTDNFFTVKPFPSVCCARLVWQKKSAALTRH